MPQGTWDLFWAWIEDSDLASHRVAQTAGAAINPEWQILAGHLAFLAVLVLRPRGLFPRAAD